MASRRRSYFGLDAQKSRAERPLTCRPRSRQLGDWFWNETAAGATIHALRETCLSSEDERLRLIAGNFMVPAARVRRSG